MRIKIGATHEKFMVIIVSQLYSDNTFRYGRERAAGDLILPERKAADINVLPATAYKQGAVLARGIYIRKCSSQPFARKFYITFLYRPDAVKIFRCTVAIQPAIFGKFRTAHYPFSYAAVERAHILDIATHLIVGKRTQSISFGMRKTEMRHILVCKTRLALSRICPFTHRKTVLLQCKPKQGICPQTGTRRIP